MNNDKHLLQVDCVRAKRGGHGKAKARLRADVVVEELPQRESMRRPHLHNRKKDNGKLTGVLKGFLRGRLGQSWDAVYGELCQRMRREHALDQYARDWVEHFVLRNVRIDEDGVLREQPHDCGLWDDFYVHPQTGTLEFASRPKAQPRREPKPLVETKKVGGVIRYAKDRGIWYEVTLAPIPTVSEVKRGLPKYVGTTAILNAHWLHPRGPVDVILRHRAIRQDTNLEAHSYWQLPAQLRAFQAAWGGMVYACKKRQLNGDELAREELRNDVIV